MIDGDAEGDECPNNPEKRDVWNRDKEANEDEDDAYKTCHRREGAAQFDSTIGFHLLIS